jgi:hypothetical protein
VSWTSPWPPIDEAEYAVLDAILAWADVDAAHS